MIAFLLWYLLVSLIGLAAFPLVFPLFARLPGRGYGFARIAGLLLWGYCYWLLGSFNVVLNDSGGALLAFGLLLAAGIWVWRSGRAGRLFDWARENRRHILVVEVLFFGAFAVLALVRAANPDIYGTEKPMELAFINGILRSPDFPPRDPWLSGFAISYYYFGYLIVASLARLTGTAGSVAFNLGLSLVFALGAVASYSLVYDLLATRSDQARARNQADGVPGSRSIQPFALLAPVFVLLLSNVVGLLEVLHARGLLWFRDASGALSSPFWRWLDLQELSQPPGEPFTWLPRDFGTGSWWWWRASRVIQDYDLGGGWKEVIDEFPSFSFVLGDLHPHVLGIPFVLLGIALAFNVYLGGAVGRFRFLGFRVNLNLPSFFFAAVVLGGLAFLNIWDFPSFLILFGAAYVLGQTRRLGWSWRRLGDFLGITLLLGIAGFFAYLPYHLSFASQVRGIIPNLVYVTRGVHLWIMFGLFLLPLFGFLIFSYRRWGDRRMLGRGLLAASFILLVLLVGSFLLAGGILALPLLDGIGSGGVQGVAFNQLAGMFLASIGAGAGEGLLGESLARRLQSPGAWITLLALLALAIGLLWPKKPRGEAIQKADRPDHTSAFVILLILFGGLIVLAPEFAYLWDQFGWRINTVFKLYYQAWLVWGIAVAAGLAIMASGSRLWRIGSAAGVSAILAVGLIYPILGIWDRTQGFQPPNGLRLDGALYSPYLTQEDRFAVDWLKGAPIGTLAEAVGGSFTEFGRISAHVGFPTVLGWTGHESQWRGGGSEMGSREPDIQTLYSTRDWAEARRILDQYGIRYVYIGALERGIYDVFEAKFRENLRPVYEFGGVTIYEALTPE